MSDVEDLEDAELDRLMAMVQRHELNEQGQERLVLLTARQEARRKAGQTEHRFKLLHGGLSAGEVAMLSKGGDAA